jgi:hypothetical protein
LYILLKPKNTTIATSSFIAWKTKKQLLSYYEDRRNSQILENSKIVITKLIKYFSSPSSSPLAKNKKLHRSDYRSSKSNYIVVHDPTTPRKDTNNCFTNTIRLHTKNSLSIYN